MVEAHQICQLAGGRWPYASANLIHEDVWASLIACMRLQTSATSLLFSNQAVKMLTAALSDTHDGSICASPANEVDFSSLPDSSGCPLTSAPFSRTNPSGPRFLRMKLPETRCHIQRPAK